MWLSNTESRRGKLTADKLQAPADLGLDVDQTPLGNLGEHVAGGVHRCHRHSSGRAAHQRQLHLARTRRGGAVGQHREGQGVGPRVRSTPFGRTKVCWGPTSLMYWPMFQPFRKIWRR